MRASVFDFISALFGVWVSPRASITRPEKYLKCARVALLLRNESTSGRSIPADMKTRRK